MGNNTGCGSHKRSTDAKAHFKSGKDKKGKNKKNNDTSNSEINDTNNTSNSNINNNLDQNNQNNQNNNNKNNNTDNKSTNKSVQKSKYYPKEDLIKNDVDNFTPDDYSINISLYITLKGIQEDLPYQIELFEYQNIRKAKSKSIGKTDSSSRDKETNMIKFKSPIDVYYHFSQNQPLEFSIFNQSLATKAKVEVSMGEIIGSNGQKYRRNFESGLIFEVEAVLEESDEGEGGNNNEKELMFDVRVEGKLTGMKINYEITSLGSQFDPMNKAVYESESLENNSKIFFKQVNIPVSELSNDGNFDYSLIQINIKDLNHGNILAKYSGNISQLLQGEENQTILEISNENKCIIKCIKKNFYSLLDFLNKDFHIYTTFALDFSEKSGKFDSPGSLHYAFGNEGSYYNSMISSCISILSPYADDGFYHVYGTGLELNNKNFLNNTENKNIYENFVPINLRIDNPSIEGTNISKTYCDFLKMIEPKKTLNLSHILNFFQQKIKEDNEGFEDELNEYNVIVFIVGGDPDDKEEFVNELIKCSNYPLSIVCIGLGKGPFKILEDIKNNFMELTNSQGEEPKRKCFSFVTYENCGKNMQNTTKNAVIDLPNEIIEFLTLNNISPKD